jgi:hypothetical protein
VINVKHSRTRMMLTRLDPMIGHISHLKIHLNTTETATERLSIHIWVTLTVESYYD